ncbi:hypothetical protein SAMN05216337_1017130 [Bradyrhizobium brasilense]|uniref:Uncharacterized protein n=1 Tax=Bradyrhizobium brasilense TaxID=1419277 RepID=A0A1G6YZ51_9BRAD|nr:hypothetical protein [Bradyrhizobium brasilense]SDD94925.1 hypothetical protein SAMN05216337_1017130 [Bradyrhizobium brasilense]
MITDSLVNFLPIGSNLAITNASLPSNVYDILGQGVGTAPANIIGTRTLFGSDVGIGGVKPQVDIGVGQAFATGNGATLNVAFQGAPDTGAGGNYQPGAWQTLVETGPLAAAQLTAAQIIGRFDFPPAFPANLNARYLRLLFQLAVGQFNAGSIAFAIVTMVRDDQANKFAAKNFSVA